MDTLSLMVAFRRSGWQWPLYPGDAVLVYDPARRLIAELSGTLLAALLEHHLHGAQLATQVREARPVLTDAAPVAAPAGRADSPGAWRPGAAARRPRAARYRRAPRRP